jgi:hypothetical protein
VVTDGTVVCAAVGLANASDRAQADADKAIVVTAVVTTFSVSAGQIGMHQCGGGCRRSGRGFVEGKNSTSAMGREQTLA